MRSSKPYAPASGWRKNRRTPSLIPLAFALVVLGGCYQRERPKNNWADLCAKTDCEKYPVGYSTVEMAGAIYYFPVSSDLFSVARGEAFIDIDDKGRVRRAAHVNPTRIYLTPCCYRTLESLGEPHVSIAGRVDIGPGADDTPNGMREALSRLLPGGDPSVLPSWNDDFYLLEKLPEKRPASVRYAPLRLISKEKLLLGSHIYLDCDLGCDAALLDQPDKSSTRLGVRLTGVMLFPGSTCPSETPNRPEPVSCKPAEEALKDIPNKIRMLQRILDRVSAKPQI